MDTPAASQLRISQIGNIAIPAGDPGEQLVAHLLLSILVCQSDALPSARAHIAQAHELAVKLNVQTVTYRPNGPSKFARVQLELEGETDTVLLPFINDILVLPPVDPGEIMRSELTAGYLGNLRNLDVAYFMLRLRTRKLAVAIEPMKKMESVEELNEATRRILAGCLYREIISADPLSRANDYFTLAHNLIGKRNRPLAAIALAKADSELEIHMRTTPLREHTVVVEEMKEQITAMVKKLKSGAA
jgi:hypothetical protein